MALLVAAVLLAVLAQLGLLLPILILSEQLLPVLIPALLPERKQALHLFPNRFLAAVQSSLILQRVPEQVSAKRFSLAILDGMVYLQTPKKMFACTVEEFVEGGTPPFKEIYNNEVDIPSLKDSVQ